MCLRGDEPSRRVEDLNDVYNQVFGIPKQPTKIRGHYFTDIADLIKQYEEEKEQEQSANLNDSLDQLNTEVERQRDDRDVKTALDSKKRDNKRSDFIGELHNAASSIEKEVFTTRESLSLHSVHTKMDIARALRMAANYLDGIQVT